jgi:hypothetical protein
MASGGLLTFPFVNMAALSSCTSMQAAAQTQALMNIRQTVTKRTELCIADARLTAETLASAQ